MGFGDGDWFVAFQLAIAELLAWHTRRDPYATLPGFVIGYIVGDLMSSGIGPDAALRCGVCVGTFGVVLNAICRGFWLAGAVAILAMVNTWAIVWSLIL